MNKTLEECVRAGCIYAYEISYYENSVGIVIAESQVDARKKVREAYLKHGYNELELERIVVVKIQNGWFADSPDVLEIY